MKGYIRNKSSVWRHAMKRSIGPGHKIPLDELFKQYGEKHNLEEGQPFVEWLRQVKLRDTAIWEVVENDKIEPEIKDKPTKRNNDMLTSPILKKDMEVSDITSMSVRMAREQLKKITDLKLMKYALSEANKMANKDTLVRMIRKRISELELTRR